MAQRERVFVGRLNSSDDWRVQLTRWGFRRDILAHHRQLYKKDIRNWFRKEAGRYVW